MKALDKFLIRVTKATEHARGCRELNQSVDEMTRPFMHLLDDKKLLDELELECTDEQLNRIVKATEEARNLVVRLCVMEKTILSMRKPEQR